MQTIKIIKNYSEIFEELNFSEKEIESLESNLIEINQYVSETDLNLDLALIKVQTCIDDSLTILNNTFIQMYAQGIPYPEYDFNLKTLLKFKILCSNDIYLSIFSE